MLELWWADEVSLGRLENLLVKLMIALVESHSGWRDLAGLLRSKPPAAMDAPATQAIWLMKQDIVPAFAAACRFRDIRRTISPTHSGIHFN